MRELSNDGIAITVPDHWLSVENNGPYALKRADGFGYLQFSVAFSAVKLGPVGSGRDMLDMVLYMAKGYELGEPSEINTEDAALVLGAASFSKSGNYYRLWEVSDGLSLVSAVYTCPKAAHPASLQECEQIVRSIKVAPAPDCYKPKPPRKWWQFWR